MHSLHLGYHDCSSQGLLGISLIIAFQGHHCVVWLMFISPCALFLSQPVCEPSLRFFLFCQQVIRDFPYMFLGINWGRGARWHHRKFWSWVVIQNYSKLKWGIEIFISLCRQFWDSNCPRKEVWLSSWLRWLSSAKMFLGPRLRNSELEQYT